MAIAMLMLACHADVPCSSVTLQLMLTLMFTLKLMLTVAFAFGARVALAQEVSFW